jgi:putative glycosyltransferase (TIGR04372 family)
MDLVWIVPLSPKGRISLFVHRLETAVREKNQERRWSFPWIVAVNPSVTPNSAVREHFRRLVFFIDEHRFPRLRRVLLALNTGVRSTGPTWPKNAGSSLTPSDDRETNSLLERLDVDPARRIVLLSVRDSAYYSSLWKEDPSGEWGRESLRDTWIRNPLIASYREACRELVESGYSVIRVGVNQSPLSSDWQDIATDYAALARSDRGDLLLARRCEFVLNGASGFWVFAAMFDRPQLQTDVYKFFKPGSKSADDVFVPQLVRDLKTGRLLSIREMAQAKGRLSVQSELTRSEKCLVPVSSEELVQYVREMIRRLRGNYIENEIESARRRRFNEILADERAGFGPAQVATSFLDRYSSLL